MSSYVVSDATIDVVLSLLDTRGAEPIIRALHPFTLPDDPRDARDRLGAEILTLNDEAAGLSIGEPPAPEQHADYRFRQETRPLAWTLKQLDCLIYQLSEGDIPERPLFKALERIRREIADRILTANPEYAASPWGMPARANG